ncbi:MAG: sigma-70 family RNA polymerase sigma factor, partial [Planctomycetota bacterium]
MSELPPTDGAAADGLSPGGDRESDLSLVQGFLAGDRQAEVSLGHRLSVLPRILRTLNARSGRPLAEEDLLDLVQDVGVIVLRKLESYDGRVELDGWTYGICRFEYLNAIRRLSRRPRPVEEFELESATDGEQSSLEAERAAADLEAGLRALAEDERAVVRAKHFDDLTFEAIAERLGCSANTAKTRYYRGMRKLQQFMAP